MSANDVSILLLLFYAKPVSARRSNELAVPMKRMKAARVSEQLMFVFQLHSPAD